MATPTTRMALSEIPDRLEQLRVAISPTNQLADEPTPANVLNPTIFDHPQNNIAMAYYSSPIPSPDEIVIRQRGRRRITLSSYSPEKCSARSPFPKTPTKNVTGLSTMTLRSSPRKRLDSSPSIKFNINNKLMLNGNISSPKIFEQLNKWTGTPVVKRLKLEEKSLASQSNSDIPLHIQLKGLSQDQLIGIIKTLVKDDAKIEDKIRKEFPLPDISAMEDQLMHIKRNIFKSLPTSRLCKKTDSTSYARAVTHLTAFKKSIFDNSKLLYDSGHWDALLDYVTMAWNYVRATPIWDNNSQNAVRRHCFKILGCNCVAAIKFGGQGLGEQRLYDLQRNIQEWSKDYEDILSCVGYLNQVLLKIRAN